MTKEEFISKAREIHGGKYGYDNVKWLGRNKKVLITCSIHGDFPQRAGAHLNGQGCPYCVGNKKMTMEDFITRAIEVHGNRYDYSLLDTFKNVRTRILIKCNECNTIFLQLPYNHLNGNGCPECVNRIKRLTKEEFIKKAKEKHDSKYDYSLVKINSSNKTKVTIKCNTCGTIFKQRIDDHLNGHGCSVCAKKKRTEMQRMTKEKFISKAREIHGGKYTYDNVEWNGYDEKVMITCQKHGNFPQLPNDHLSGKGCPHCKSSKLEIQTRNLLNKYNIAFESQMKFTWLMSSKNYPMKLDFYLPKYNVAIECQGIQHYEARGDIFTEEKVNAIKKRDIMKFQLCKEHGIPIYYIRYDENVEESINKLLSRIKT